MKQLALLLAVSAAVLSGCKEDKKPAESASATPPAAAAESAPAAAPAAPAAPAAETSAKPVGTYKGLLPCASCEGIETTLTLKDDGSYDLTTLYVGEKDAQPSTVSGQYRLSDDKTLVRLDDAGFNYVYFIGDNLLEMRDADGTTGERNEEMNAHYRLQKQ